MKMYKALKDLEVDSDNIIQSDRYSIMEGAIKKYCLMKKKGKTHRSVIDRNRADIMEIEQSIPLHPNAMSKNDGNTHIKDEMIGKLIIKMNSM